MSTAPLGQSHVEITTGGVEAQRPRSGLTPEKHGGMGAREHERDKRWTTERQDSEGRSQDTIAVAKHRSGLTGGKEARLPLDDRHCPVCVRDWVRGSMWAWERGGVGARGRRRGRSGLLIAEWAMGTGRRGRLYSTRGCDRERTSEWMRGGRVSPGRRAKSLGRGRGRLLGPGLLAGRGSPRTVVRIDRTVRLGPADAARSRGRPLNCSRLTPPRLRSTRSA
jgi:hypothetical protein